MKNIFWIFLEFDKIIIFWYMLKHCESLDFWGKWLSIYLWKTLRTLRAFSYLTVLILEPIALHMLYNPALSLQLQYIFPFYLFVPWWPSLQSKHRELQLKATSKWLNRFTVSAVTQNCGFSWTIALMCYLLRVWCECWEFPSHRLSPHFAAQNPAKHSGL